MIALLASGVGDWKLSDEMAALIPNNANNGGTGNITVTTEGFNANSGYTIILELKKTAGYAHPNLQKNNELGYPGGPQGY
jgi:hypothetical protein